MLGTFLAPFIALGFAVAKILSNILREFNLGDILCVKDEIFLPIVYLHHPKTSRKIVLVGVMHIGGTSYYKDLLGVKIRKLRTLHGYKVLFEGVGRIYKHERKNFSSEENEVYQFMQALMKDRPVIAKTLGIAEQGKALPYHPSWIRTDMDAVDLVEAVAQKNISFKKWTKNLKAGSASLYDEDEIIRDFMQMLTAMNFNFMLQTGSGLQLLQKIPMLFSRKLRILKSLILDERNKLALRGIYKYVKKSNVVSIWGSAHLPGIIKGLKKLGYVVEKKEWCLAHTVGNEYAKAFYEKHGEEIEKFKKENM